MAEANLFPSPIASPDLISLEEVALTEEEKKIAKDLGWNYKFKGIVSRYRTNQVRWLLTIVPFIIRLLSARGGVDVVERLIDYLSVSDFLYLAAVTDGHLLPFFRSTSRIYKRFVEKVVVKLYKNKRDCMKGPVALRPTYFSQLTSGKELLRAYRTFKVNKFLWKIDDSTLFDNSYITLIEFHPTRPILAMVDASRKLYVIAYGGEERQRRGQILYIEPAPKYSLSTFRALNWSPNGEFLLALEGPLNKSYDVHNVYIRLCKYKIII
jgi:hypothetical protein